MQYITNTLEFKIEESTVISLGKFDGLHRGHELLMKNLMQKKQEHGYEAVVFTFDIPPRAEVADVEAHLLTTNEEKRWIFEHTGIDYLIECPFTQEIMHMPPEEFVRWMVEALHVKCFVVGKDFHFGYQRKGDYQVLQQHAKTYGYEVVVLDKMQEYGRDISSTFIREEIACGNIEKANELLGYSFFAKAKIIHGKQLGRTIGIPTINMELPKEKLLPPRGVYATKVWIDHKWYAGVTNVGCKPTVSNTGKVGVETNILNFEADLYGKDLEVFFLHFIRPEKKFDSVESLKEQIERDVQTSREYFEKNILLYDENINKR
ncbi:MAG: bifunctional riboflavin kinase/FAD synthetase [Lachnospiraceae bacterium]|nr:bifunctional riboflavin kinase/FAD synthetase [Lachnospiraceae bacterium]